MEERIIRMREAQTIKYQKDLQKMKLKYEILARNQINSRLSEMNEFLNERQKEQDEEEKKKSDVTEAIQNDLAKRLQISRDELTGIKQQMKGDFFILQNMLRHNQFFNPFRKLDFIHFLILFLTRY